MADWWRSWHGAPTDNKWLAIARRAEAPVSLVVAVAWSLLDRASQSTPRGSIRGYDAESLAAFLQCETAQVIRIVESMHGKCVLVDDTFAHWDERQPRREDDSYQRVRDYRTVTQRNAVKRSVTQRNAVKRDVTLEESRGEESREDQEKKNIPLRGIQKEKPQNSSLSLTANDCSDERNSNKSNGSRLALETLPESWKQWCKLECPALSPDATWEKFRDYWIGKAGAAARKADWQATWRNWCRRERDDARSSGKRKSAQPPQTGPIEPIIGDPDEWRRKRRGES